MDSGLSSGKQILRKHLVEVFAEVACYSTTEANRLMDKYENYRKAIGNPEHPFWKAEARQMLDEATKVEFGLRLKAEEHLGQDDLSVSFH